MTETTGAQPSQAAARLGELLARVEASSGPDRELDCALAVALDGFFTNGTDGWGRPLYCYRDEMGITSPGQGHDMLVRPYTASLDAALALVERCKPEWVGMINICIVGISAQVQFQAIEPCDPTCCEATGSTPALTLLAALLRALLATEAALHQSDHKGDDHG